MYTQVRCLISKADPSIKRAKERETQYTLEAISLNGLSSWIGINQSAVTRCFDPIDSPSREMDILTTCQTSAASQAYLPQLCLRT